jgi:hypothetical protein
MVERPGLAREIGAEIDDRDRVSIGHGFSWHPLAGQISTRSWLGARSGRSPAISHCATT